METFNPALFIWARETAGLTPTEAASALKLSPSTLEKIEQGEVQPSEAQLGRMSDVYRRTPTVFYLAAPPSKGTRGQDFRSVREQHASKDEVRLDSLIREVMSRHSIIRSAAEDSDEITFSLPIGRFHAEQDTKILLASICAHLNISREAYRGQKSVDEAFSYLRKACEEKGIFVVLLGNLGSHHTNIPPTVFRGFAIADQLAPMIIINDQDAKAAWPFTLLHEVAHLWIGQTGISAGFSENSVEILCNNIAGEFLLPESDIGHGLNGTTTNELVEYTSAIAKKFKVSRLLVAYRLYLYRRISAEAWSKLDAELRSIGMAERERAKETAKAKESGPDYFVVKRHRMGALTHFVQHALNEGYITTVKAAKVLGVNPRSLQTMIEGG